MLRLLIWLLTLLCAGHLMAQTKVRATTLTDSLPAEVIKHSDKYVNAVNNKVNKFNSQVYGKMEKTLGKLAKWEGKIQRILHEASPETEQRLFGPNQMTFTKALEKLRTSQSLVKSYQGQFNYHTDKLKSSLGYLQTQSSQLKKLESINLDSIKQQLSKSDDVAANAEWLDEFIKERKTQLISETFRYIGKSKYLKQINKECFYYTEAIRNYKSVLNDSRKTEELVLKALSQIPEFKNFAQQNSAMAGIFPSMPSMTGGSMPIVNGLAPRQMVQERITTASAGNAGQLQQQLQSQPPIMPSNLDAIKQKAKGIKDGLEDEFSFKKNTQRNKPFLKRLEFTSDYRFAKSTRLLPANMTIGATAGYKLSDDQSIGIGLNYLLGLGRGWKDLRLSHEGIGLRSYIKWRFKYNIFFQVGAEWTYMTSFKRVDELKSVKNWQQTTLAGLTKSYSISRKVKGNVQLSYNFLHRKTIPTSSPFIIRFGYEF